MPTRRTLLTMLLAATALAPFRPAQAAFAVTLTPDEWRARLTPAQYAILREAETERAFSNSLMGESSPLLTEARKGTYHCAGCTNPVYPSATSTSTSRHSRSIGAIRRSSCSVANADARSGARSPAKLTLIRSIGSSAGSSA